MSVTKKIAGTSIATLAVCLSVGAIDAFAQKPSPSPKPVSKSAVKSAKIVKAKITTKTSAMTAHRSNVPMKPTLRGLGPSVTQEKTHMMTGVGIGAEHHITSTDAGTVRSESNASNPSQPKLDSGVPPVNTV